MSIVDRDDTVQHGLDIGEYSHNVIKQGWLLKQSRYLQNWRRRWIVLTDANLISYKNPTATVSTEILPLNECNTVKSAEGLGHRHAFRVDTPSRVFFLVASSAAEKESWIGAIGKHMVFNNQTHAYTEEDVVY